MIAAVQHIARWREHPDVMVKELFAVKPDAWQEEALKTFPHSPRMAFKSCKGPGKSAVLAWFGWNFLLTRPHPMIGVTSISGANLRTNLWTELARWRNKSPLLQHLFEMNKTEIFAKEHPKTWKMEARTWPADADATQIGNALAGLHATYVMWLLDEVGDYPDAIMPTCEAIFAGEPKEARIAMAGNPTRLSGPLYRACTSSRSLWRVIEITADPDDPKRTPRVSVEHAREQIQQYGASSPWVMVNIYGKFPPASLNALIGPDEVAAAMKRCRTPIGVQFAGEAQNRSRYFNRRAEMYLEAIQWIKRGGALPESAELLSALTATTYCFKGDRFLLEPKDDIKAKIGFSPDEADAFALTFAQRVISKREQERSRFRRRSAVQEWDPFREPRNHGDW